MNPREYSTPLPLCRIQITDAFWQSKMEMVRTEMLPYQWKALNDQIEGAEPSYCIHNFRTAAKLNGKRKELGDVFEEPEFTFRGFQMLPEDPDHLLDQFYGFVFQDSDLYKWIEAVAYSLTNHPDEQLERQADDAIDLICAAQLENGYLDTYYILSGQNKIFSNLRDHHELYCFGHLVEAAVAYQTATGKDKLLCAATRFADFIADYFGSEDGKCKGYPGHEIAEMALIRLYEMTGEKKYLDLSAFFVFERGKRPYYFDGEEAAETIPPEQAAERRYSYYQAHLPVLEQKEVTGHAVRAMYLYSGVTDVARINQDGRLFATCERLWNNMLGQKLYITGAVGATHIGEAFSYPYDLPNDTTYGETCASIGLVFWARRMLQIRPDSRYGDVMELALYNSVLSGVSLDGKSFFYVNPLQVTPEACRLDERIAHVKAVRQKWFGCACCPPNLARLLSSLGSYAYTERENVIFIHFYLDGTVLKMVHGEWAEISIKSDYLWNGTVGLSVKGTGRELTVALRIPGWCQGKYQLCGVTQAETWMENGYLYLRKTWQEEDCVWLQFPMKVQIMEADSRVREDIGQVAVMRGPLVYCLEEADNGQDLHLLSVDVKAKPQIVDQTIAGNNVKSVILQGYRREKNSSKEEGLYHVLGQRKESGLPLTFIPYFAWANRGENEMRVWIREH